jgi:hypothetical protein
MTYLTLLLAFLSFTISYSGPIKTIEPGVCPCETYQTKSMELLKKGDAQKFLLLKLDFRLQLVQERMDHMAYFASHKMLIPGKKTKINSSIQELERVESQLIQLSGKIKAEKVFGSEKVKNYLYQIQKDSGLSLKKSSDILFGTYHSDDIPPFQIIKPGGGNKCEEGQTPPNYDCGSVAEGVNRACMDGIQQKMDCGYYARPGVDNEQQMSQDMQECTTAMENSRTACQRANENCNYNYNTQSDQYDFWRRASMQCSLREVLSRPAETQTSTGN